MGRRRAHLSLKTKLAAALLTIKRVDATGVLVPVIDYEMSKTMTADQICAAFEFDHTTLAAFGGGEHPSNLVPRPVAEHKEKSRRDTTIAAKAKRINSAEVAFRHRLLAKNLPSSNGRTSDFGSENGGSSPPGRTKILGSKGTGFARRYDRKSKRFVTVRRDCRNNGE